MLNKWIEDIYSIIEEGVLGQNIGNDYSQVFKEGRVADLYGCVKQIHTYVCAMDPMLV